MDTITAAYALAKEIGFSLIIDEDRSKRQTFAVINCVTGKSNTFYSRHEALGYLKSMSRFIKETERATPNC